MPRAQADTRSRIARTARALFVRRGPERVSMRSVARAVGITAPAIYRHYPSRAALLEEIAQEGLRLLERSMREALAAPTPPKRLLAMVDRYVDFALRHPRDFDWMFLRARPGALRFPADFAARKSPTANLIQDEVRAAMAEGSFRRDEVHEVCMAIWAVPQGLIALHRAGRLAIGAEDFRALCRHSLERLFEGLAA